MTNDIVTQDIEQLAQLAVWKKLRGRSLLITGATGMLGAYLALAAEKANRLGGYDMRLILLGRNRARADLLFDRTAARLLLQDVRTPLALDEPVDYVLHTAGPVGPAVFADAPLEVLSANVTGTIALLDFSRRHGCQGFVFASTHEVYGAVRGEQFEDSALLLRDSMDPRGSYVLAKQAGENALACACKQYGLRAMSARLSRLYGPLMNTSSGLFVCDFINDALSGAPVSVHAGENLLRPLCYAADAAAALLYILAFGSPGSAYNVQGSECSTICQVADLLAGYAGCDVSLDNPEIRQLPPSGHWLNTKRLQALGWRQRVSLADGICRTLAAFRQR